MGLCGVVIELGIGVGVDSIGGDCGVLVVVPEVMAVKGVETGFCAEISAGGNRGKTSDPSTTAQGLTTL